jgi:histidine phosphotransfer protein HptB
MSEPTVDSTVFKELQDTAGEDFAKELVDTFLEDAPSMLAELRSALVAGDADKFRRAAHSLKSNSLTFGAARLGAMARDLEHKGLEHAREAVAEGVSAVDALGHEYARVAAALKGLRDG